jgi:hypothetical protein
MIMETVNKFSFSTINITDKDIDLICQIADRACNQFNINDKLNLEMDIIAIHANDVGLRLTELLKADDFNFAHDIFGITSNINRETGKLENCFLPRFSK